MARPRGLSPEATLISQLDGCPERTVSDLDATVFGAKIEIAHITVFNLFVQETLGLNGEQQEWPAGQVGPRRIPDRILTDEHFKKFNLLGFRTYWHTRQTRNDVPGVDLTGVPSPYAWWTPTFEEGNRLEDMEEDAKLLKNLILNAASSLGRVA